MSRLRRMLQFLALSDEPEVILAQHREIMRQVPLLYALLIVNTAAVAFTHRHFAPPLLAYAAPTALCILSLYRTIKWAPFRNREISFEAARAQLKQSIVFAGCYGVVAVSWALIMAQYGGPYEQGHVALYISITVIACIFCLMYLPQAALLGCLLVTGPYITYYFLQRRPVWTAIALNILLVSLVMVRVLLNSFKGFVDLVRSQRDMAIKTAEAELLSKENARLAMTDSLTGLPNRRYFFAKLEDVIEAARASNSRFAVGVVDLDRFKPVNDSYGHMVGDQLLEEVGRRLERCSSDDLIVTRLGGDEFGIIVRSDDDQIAATGQYLCDEISRPYLLDGMRVAIGCSGGFAIFPDAGETAPVLFDRSDYALYNAKSQQRGSISLFSVEHEVQLRAERTLEVALRAADLDAELLLHFQPIVDLKTMQIVSVEALARWDSPTLGQVGAHRFIPVAERYGLIGNVTRILFGKALDALDRLPERLAVSFNLSSEDIVSDDMIAFISDAIRDRGIDPRRLVFELTETAVMRDFDLAVRNIRRLRALGCKIALDDFGTGYSNLAYLRRLRVDKVKIDRSFVVSAGARSRGLLAAIKLLCERLRLACVVEGIETAEQLRMVGDLGFEEVQGYLLGRPQALDALHADTPMDMAALGMLTGGKRASTAIAPRERIARAVRAVRRPRS